MKTARHAVAVSVFLTAAVGPSLSPTAAHAQVSADNQPLVTVGGQTITRGEYLGKLEIAAGKAVLNKLVFTAIVRQAATKAGLMPADKDVDARLADLQRTNPQQAQLVATPLGREDLTTDIALENLRLRDVTVSDAEVANFYTRHPELFTLPSQVQTTMVVSKSKADSERAEILLGQDVTPEAIAAKPGLRVAGVNGFNVNMAALPADTRQKVGQTVLAMKTSQVKTIPIQDDYFLTFKVKSAHGNELPPLSQVKSLVTRQAKLQKAVSPQQELAILYAASPPTFSDARYKAYFENGTSAPAGP